MDEPHSQVSKIIWSFWMQGKSAAPMIVKNCWESWAHYNPEFELRIITQANLKCYTEVKRSPGMSIQAFSDILRINLLQQYGGVWVDATCFCCKPLMDWLPEVTQNGFFVFRNPGKDRIIASWFIAAKKNNYVIENMCQNVNEYWSEKNEIDPTDRGEKNIYQRFLNQCKSPDRTYLYFSDFFRKRTHPPYFWFHYLFAYLVRQDPEFRNDWLNTPKKDAKKSLFWSRGWLKKTPTDALKKEIDSREIPVYKLSWRSQERDGLQKSGLDYLLASHLKKCVSA